VAGRPRVFVIACGKALLDRIREGVHGSMLADLDQWAPLLGQLRDKGLPTAATLTALLTGRSGTARIEAVWWDAARRHVWSGQD
jgi:hypothetical protein